MAKFPADSSLLVLYVCRSSAVPGSVSKVTNRGVSFPVQYAIRAPKQYLYRTLPDSPRMAAWWDATTAAVQAVRASGRTPRVLLLGAKAGVLAVAALRVGAAHVTCVERWVLLLALTSCALADASQAGLHAELWMPEGSDST